MHTKSKQIIFVYNTLHLDGKLCLNIIFDRLTDYDNIL